MTDATPVQVVDIDLTSFRIPSPPIWRSRFAPLIAIFGFLFLALILIFGAGHVGAMVGLVFIFVPILILLGFSLWNLPGLIRDRTRSSVPGRRLPFAQPEDLSRVPPGFTRPLGEIIASMQTLEAGAPPPEVIRRPVPPEVRRHALAYQVGAALVGVIFVALLCVGIGGALPTILAMLVVFTLLTRARRVTARSAEEVISHDPRAPILFLRSFMDDQIKVRQWQRYIGMQNPMPLRFEEALGDMIGRYGPFLAIGEPSEGLPQLGAARAYPGDSEWQTTVLAWIGQARLITMLCGPTRWVHWEVQNIVAAARLNRLLLFLPPGRGRQMQARRRRVERWDNIVKSLEATPYGPAMKALTIDDVLLIQFGEGRLNVFRSAGDMSQDYALAAVLAASLAVDAPADAADAAPGVAPAASSTPPLQPTEDGKGAVADPGGQAAAPADLPWRMAGVGLVLGLITLFSIATRGPLGVTLSRVGPFLFAAAVTGAVALWAGRERGQWPRLAAALVAVALLNLLLDASLVRLLTHMGFSLRHGAVQIMLFVQKALLVGALAIASRPFRAPPTWGLGLLLAVTTAFLSLVSMALHGPVSMFLLLFPPVLTAAWIGFGLSRRTLM